MTPIETKKLTAVLKCLSTFVSDDATRAHLCTVNVKGRTLEATDGHCAIRIKLTSDLWSEVTDAKRGAVVPTNALARLKAGLLPDVLEREANYYPELDHVFPEVSDEFGEEKARRVGFDASLLGGRLSAVGTLARAWGVKQPGVRIQWPESKSGAIRFDATFEAEIVVSVVVMPMRLD